MHKTKYAHVKVPDATRFQHQDHAGDISDKPYYHQNNVAKKLVQDSFINTSDQASKRNICLPSPPFTPLPKKYLPALLYHSPVNSITPPLLPLVPTNPNTIMFLRIQLEELKKD